MKTPTYVNNCILALMLLIGIQCFAQNVVPFLPRYDEAIKGDMLLIGNSNVGLHITNPYNGNNTNDRIDAAVYVDIDSDPTTFNSSTADLDVPSDTNCYQIVYAGLYWSAVVNGAEPISDIKFRVPGSTAYQDITGTQIYFQNAANNRNSNTYVYYHDVTDILTALPNPEGTYGVANISSLVGPKPNSEGLSAGWSLFVIYEDPLLPSKYITSFDGFTKITSAINETFPISGFQTIPVGPVRAKFAFSTIEGDRRYTGDYLELNNNIINATDNSGTVIRPGNNFFNSTVSIIDPVTNTPELFFDRNPAGTNTLGFDAGIINIPNAGNTIIGNGDTNATISLGSNLDIYYYYFSAFAIEIIAPNIVLTKIVEDEFGTDIEGQEVDLGDELNYVIGFQNTGNDDARPPVGETGIIIRDILPINIIFNYPADIVSLPPGVTVKSYDASTREIIFQVDESLVEENDPVQEIRFSVTVVSDCSLLTDACSNIISNQAYVTYRGTINDTFEISDDPSYNSNTGCLITPRATNFLGNLNCTFDENVVLCGDSTTLTAGNGYDSYTWSTSPSGTPVIGTGQSITVTSTGTYYVYNAATAPCQSITQQFDVTLFGSNVTNPVIPFADEVVICPNDGKELPNIFLCGANDSRFIQTNITDTSSMIWEVLDESSCTAVLNQDCANESDTCSWNQVATGASYTADTAGQYRLTLNYDGGCFNQFYFNVYENLLVPNVASRDIICTTPGEIIIGGVPSGYEYSIDGINYQVSNTFVVNTPGIYSAYIRQVGVTPNPCIFTVPDVQIRERDFAVQTTVTQPICYGELGSVVLAANDARPQYFFSIYDGVTLVNSVGPITDDNYTFENLNPGTYIVNVSTEDGCTYTGNVEIIEPPILEATSAITKPITCTDGEITVYPTGGTPPYYYFVNGSATFQSTPIINAPTAATYTIRVVDFNNCEVETIISIDAIPAPDFTVAQTDILCSDDPDSGTITVNVTNPNGNTLRYSVDNGTTYQNSPNFTNLTAGDYDVIVEYTLGTDVCTTTPQTITITTATAINGTVALTTPYTCTTSGIITVSGVTGGFPPYQYSIDGVNFQPGTTFTGLTNGTYTVTVRDANVCTFVAAPITIDALNPPTDLNFSSTPITCPANTSDITITTTGGLSPLEYQIIAPASAVTAYQPSSTFIGLVPGTYTFQVRDANQCTYAETYTIDPLPPLTVGTVITKNLDCTASPDGTIQGTISGGVAPFTYEVSINGGGFTSLGTTATTFNYTVTTDGTYQFRIADTNNCTTDSAVETINAISLPDITSVIQTADNLCNGDANAAIDITINSTVGTPPFVINVNNDTTGTNFGTQTSGLPAGTYTITLTDANSCEDTETITIAEPTPISVLHTSLPITCDVLSGGISKGSVIVQSVSGGTAPYNYYVTGTNGYSATELNASGTTSTTFDVVDFGLYQINVVDANGCSVLVQDVLVASPPNDLDILVNTTVDCTTGGEAIVSIGTTLVSTGPFFFDIYTGVIPPPPPGGTWVAEDTPGSQTATFTGLLPGITYTFIVYDDSTGCSYYETATASIPTNSTLTASAVTSNNITCVGSADGNVSFTINSVYGVPTNVDYEIFNALSIVTTGITGSGVVPAGGSLPVANLGALPFGTYFVSITETSGLNAGCGVVTVPFNISESAIDLSITATVDRNANCNANSGLISAIARDGTPPYTYQITTSSTAPLETDPSWASANTFNVDANTYYVHVKDAYNCIRTTTAIVLPQDPEPAISTTLNNQCTVAEGEFEIDVALATAGIAPYSYSIDGGAFQTRTAPFSISNLASGTHTIEIQDVNGCGNLVTVDIAPPVNLTPSITTLPTCSNDDGQITINGTGGTGVYTYTISPNPTGISLSGNVFSNVPSGTYTITLSDANTCFAEVEVILPEAIPPTVTTTPNAVTCFGDNTGSFELSLSGYSGPYTYEVFDSTLASVTGVVNANTSTNPVLVSGMTSGTYSVEIIQTANPFCTTTTNVIIQSPPEALTVVATETSNVTCDNNQGTITAVASGGYGTYEYELTGAAIVAYTPNGTFTNLEAGVYTVNVRDAGGCIATDNVTLIIPNPIDATISANTTLLSCFGDTNATITVTSTIGGQGSNYTYTLNQVLPTVSSSGPQTSTVFDNLGAGTYNVTVTDGYNCEFNTPNIVIDEPTEVQATLVKATSQTCLTEATLTLSALGGNGPYSYSTDSNFSSVIGTFATSITFSVPAGDYQYYVRDANGCITDVSNQITIDPLPDLTVSIDAMNANINCTGDITGVIIATAEGGLGNYVYTLQDTSGNAIPATQNSPGVFTELPAGNYQVRVDSGDCLTTSATIPITEPSLPLEVTFNTTDVTCTAENNGSIEILATGGTGIIKYAISPQMNQFFDEPIFEDLAPGTYQAVVQDELGCFVIIDFSINEPAPVFLTVVPNSIVPELCTGELNGAFSVEVSGGSLPYSVSLDNYDGPYTTGTSTQTIFDFTNLAGGNHVIYIRDNEGCEVEFEIDFPESIAFNPELVIEYGCVNNASTNTVTVNLNENDTVDPAELEYALDGGTYQSSNTFTNIAPGLDHYIDVRHINGCIQRSALFDIDDYQPLALVLRESGLNEIEATTTGGTGNYEYFLNGESYGSTNTFIIYETGTYTVTVVDTNGCQVEASIPMEFIDICIPNYFTPNDDGTLDGWGIGCASQYDDLTFDIFDRYGRKIATLNVNEKWDGRYKGKELPTGDYWFVVKLNDSRNDKEFVGHFTLYR
ncbi:T9SS type B sorting domain-containing protein [Hyunsoonleella pacifica]|uniref:T9SS type B sorting domain-containing protein n=1 Tax=Hyunsoonleella pacifica TaxID=1080224 RepID=A0A4Q9FJ56_9FLAO|nr:T9SS type B sorting domain-containing protein [Hyunsoonleella pacifica]TBN12992.1 T9SS type B sorting domain-containing protein [Hyunsoonleella pacifica]GGD28032.1 T9SS C-terminal target domain-containing protein [Hyunsoonleella pacifica]